MKNSDAAILTSRYACINFSGIHGFPNHFPKDTYFLRNGPKFKGEDLSLTLKHISNFCDFTKLLGVKHEDVCIMLFYDSFQGKCKQWIESFPVKSIKSFAEFWLMFLEEWIDRIDLVSNSPSIQGFKQWNDDHINEEIDGNFSLSLSSYLKYFECKTEDKMKFLDEVAKNIEKDIEGLQAHIQSYSIHDHDHSFQKLSMTEHKERVFLSFSFDIEEECTIFENQFEKQFESTQLMSYLVDQSTYVWSKVLEFHEKFQTDYVFYGSITDYMEKIYYSDFQLCFHLEDQIYLMLPRLFQYHVYFFFKHSQEIQVSD